MRMLPALPMGTRPTTRHKHTLTGMVIFEKRRAGESERVHTAVHAAMSRHRLTRGYHTQLAACLLLCAAARGAMQSAALHQARRTPAMSCADSRFAVCVHPRFSCLCPPLSPHSFFSLTRLHSAQSKHRPDVNIQ